MVPEADAVADESNGGVWVTARRTTTSVPTTTTAIAPATLAARPVWARAGDSALGKSPEALPPLSALGSAQNGLPGAYPSKRSADGTGSTCEGTPWSASRMGSARPVVAPPGTPPLDGSTTTVISAPGEAALSDPPERSCLQTQVRGGVGGPGEGRETSARQSAHKPVLVERGRRAGRSITEARIQNHAGRLKLNHRFGVPPDPPPSARRRQQERPERPPEALQRPVGRHRGEEEAIIHNYQPPMTHIMPV